MCSIVVGLCEKSVLQHAADELSDVCVEVEAVGELVVVVEFRCDVVGRKSAFHALEDGEAYLIDRYDVGEFCYGVDDRHYDVLAGDGGE